MFDPSIDLFRFASLRSPRSWAKGLDKIVPHKKYGPVLKRFLATPNAIDDPSIARDFLGKTIPQESPEGSSRDSVSGAADQWLWLSLVHRFRLDQEDEFADSVKRITGSKSITQKRNQLSRFLEDNWREGQNRSSDDALHLSLPRIDRQQVLKKKEQRGPTVKARTRVATVDFQQALDQVIDEKFELQVFTLVRESGSGDDGSSSAYLLKPEVKKIVKQMLGRDSSSELVQLARDLEETHSKIVRLANQRRLPFFPITPMPILELSSQEPCVKTLGIGDLILARETLVGHNTGDISHIENVLKGETRNRDYRSLNRTEEEIENEQVRETFDERDMQESESNQIQRAIEETVASEHSLAFGARQSAKYGTATVTFSQSFGQSSSKAEAEKTATEFAQKVTTRAVKRTREMVRHFSRRSELVEREELSTHSFTNTDPESSSFAGIYRWVNKLYDVELRRYGLRLMLECYVPEPGKNLLEAMGGVDSAEELESTVPSELKAQPTEIHETNYLKLAAEFGAEDVSPPPPAMVTVGWSWKSEPDESADDAGDPVASGQAVAAEYIKIPEGYTAEVARAVATGYGHDEAKSDFQVTAGGKNLINKGVDADDWAKPAVGTGFLFWGRYGESGVPVSVRASSLWDQTGTVNIVILCRRTSELLDNWRIRVSQELLLGRRKKLREIEKRRQEKIYEPPSDRNPDHNRVRELEELRKGCIHAIRGNPLEEDAVTTFSSGSVSEEVTDLSRVGGLASRIAFFEDAFEWDNIFYTLEPYYWARRERWSDMNSLVRNDPLHEKFLRAGAAKVIIPVTPGHEQMVLYYQDKIKSSDENSVLHEIENRNWDNTTDIGVDLPDHIDLWMDVLTEKHADLTKGSGTMSVVQGSPIVTIDEGSLWEANERDLTREIYFEAERYVIVNVLSRTELELDRPYEGPSDDRAKYVMGSVRVGQPWRIEVPTNLVILQAEEGRLLQRGSAEELETDSGNEGVG